MKTLYNLTFSASKYSIHNLYVSDPHFINHQWIFFQNYKICLLSNLQGTNFVLYSQNFCCREGDSCKQGKVILIKITKVSFNDL